MACLNIISQWLTLVYLEQTNSKNHQQVVYWYSSGRICRGLWGESEVTKSGSGPDRKYVLRMSPFTPPRFFLSSSNMATGCDLRSLDSFGVPLGVRIRSLKLRNIRSDRRSRDPFGSVIGVFSTTSLSYDHRKPRVLYLAWLLELALVIYSFYFRIVSRLCSTLLRVHLKIYTCKCFFCALLMFKIRQQLTKIKSINSMGDL